MLAGPASAGESSAAGEEYLSISEAVPPNVLFLIDLSSTMNDPCPAWDKDDTAYDTDRDSGDTASDIIHHGHTVSSGPCVDEVVSAIINVSQHFDWARFGVIGTTDDPDDNGYYPIAPLGSSRTAISSALTGLPTWSVDTRNLSEAIAEVAKEVFKSDNPAEDETPDWDDAAIQYYCQENHVIVLTVAKPNDDDFPESSMVDLGITGDVICDDDWVYPSGTDYECNYDNVSSAVYNADLRIDLSGNQNLVVHTIAIGLRSESVAEALFGSAAAVTDGEGVYTIAHDSDEILSNILLIMSDIESGFYSRSAPVLSSEGDYLIYSFYEIEGGKPLAEGHIRGYELDTDPASPTYGQVVIHSEDPYNDWGGALWDGGNLLVSRIVTASEYNPGDRDGAGRRDIYTFVDEMMSAALPTHVEGERDHRMSYDRSFVTALVGEPLAFDLFMDATVSTDCDMPDDLNDDCVVDTTDYQLLVDFARGYNLSRFRYMDLTRGYWKLGDAPHSTPVVVTPRNGIYTAIPSYREFLTGLKDAGTPAMVFQANNDGMLHAYYLEDDPATTSTEEGEEAWAWIPAYVLYREHDADWPGRLIDQMLYGRTFLFDGSPVVQDVCLDADGDSRCYDASEWHRVLVVQQGQGGPVTLALDITDPISPRFLWEQTDERDAMAMGYSTGRPVITNVYDASVSGTPVEHWVTIWGSGHAIPHTEGEDYYRAAEANLYMWAFADDYWAGGEDAANYNATGSLSLKYGDSYRMDGGGSNGHPEKDDLGGSLDSDGDGHYEYAYISAALTVIDVDSDGDVDTLYFPVTTTYGSSDSGDSVSDVKDPGDTWIWKALIDTTDPADIQWCDEAFYDPKDEIGSRPTVYYSATASWFRDSTMGLYWGTGSPYERTSSDPGYFFAIRDPNPKICSVGEPIDCAGLAGYYPLGDGEGLTSDPLVYASVVYFTTYLPAADRCEAGTGRVYGLNYSTCEGALDSNGDGKIDDADEPFIELDGYPSRPAISEHGTIFVGTSNPDVSGDTALLTTIQAINDPFLGTASITWMEVY